MQKDWCHKSEALGTLFRSIVRIYPFIYPVCILFIIKIMFICVSLFLLVSINTICNIVNSRLSLVIELPLAIEYNN